MHVFYGLLLGSFGLIPQAGHLVEDGAYWVPFWRASSSLFAQKEINFMRRFCNAKENAENSHDWEDCYSAVLV